MRFSVFVTAVLISCISCSHKTSYEEWTENTDPSPTSPPPVEKGNPPLDLIRSSVSQQIGKTMTIKQEVALISLDQINSAAESRIPMIADQIPDKFDMRIEVEYESPDATQPKLASFPAQYAKFVRGNEDDLTFTGLRFEVPEEVALNSRKQQITISAEGLSLVIPLKAPRLQFCSSPFLVKAEFLEAPGLRYNDPSSLKVLKYRKLDKDLSLDNLVTCGLLISAKDVNIVLTYKDSFQPLRISNPLKTLKMENPVFEIYVDGQKHELDVVKGHFDGANIAVELPPSLSTLSAETLEVRATDPKDADHYVSFTLGLVKR